ncbi:hypothetical protein CS022_03090 [Veronia nyctiphanis]|uniref:Uncharacterized protein n=1 Tax=Veronia nyctiphanis TaxID=1278244 RepID=A0A4Q0YZJ2_9GAMM|nr:hypothetical protein [Veronia nyctiphanis]RXJ74571.1 hypothetical protein CS022_03090 [Veronia nyctiphanis]
MKAISFHLCIVLLFIPAITVGSEVCSSLTKSISDEPKEQQQQRMIANEEMIIAYLKRQGCITKDMSEKQISRMVNAYLSTQTNHSEKKHKKPSLNSPKSNSE